MKYSPVYWLHLATSLSAFVIMGCSFAGWGSILFRLFAGTSPQRRDIFDCAWLGFCLQLFLLSICHLFIPINTSVSMIFHLSGCLLSIRSFGPLSEDWMILLRRHFLFLSLAGLAAVWIASRAMVAPEWFDSGMYHFNSIRWVNEYPIIAGLGNLHCRFAFNQTFFLYAASLNLDPFLHHAHNFANGFLILLLACESLLCVTRVIASPEKANISDVTRAFLLAPIAFIASSSVRISAPTPDIAVSIILLLIFSKLVTYIFTPAPAGRQLPVPLVLILSASVVTIKLSSIVFAASASALVILIALIRDKWSILKVTAISLVPLSILALWSVRGIILSGAPCYPSTFGHMNFDWAIPVNEISVIMNWIRGWARLPEQSGYGITPPDNWFHLWFARTAGFIPSVTYPLFFAILCQTTIAIRLFTKHGICTSYFRAILKGLASIDSNSSTPSQGSNIAGFRGFMPPKARNLCGSLCVLGTSSAGRRGREIDVVPDITFEKQSVFAFLSITPAIIALVHWSIYAPDPRFAHSLFWILALGSVLPLIKTCLTADSRHKSLYMLAVLFLAANLGIIYHFTREPWRVALISLSGYQPIPTAKMVEQQNPDGLTIWVPEADDALCWDSPLPSTIRVHPGLRMRGSDLRDGFRIEQTPHPPALHSSE